MPAQRTVAFAFALALPALAAASPHARAHRAPPHGTHARTRHRARAHPRTVAVGLAPAPSPGLASGPYQLPLDRAVVSLDALGHPHHDHAAIDLHVPIGTPVYAARGGRAYFVRDPRCGQGVRIEASDGYEYVYCHGSRLDVADGQYVLTGARIMLSGESATEGLAHLHFGVRVRDGRALCPQALLRDWYQGRMTAPSEAISSDACVAAPQP